MGSIDWPTVIGRLRFCAWSEHPVVVGFPQGHSCAATCVPLSQIRSVHVPLSPYRLQCDECFVFWGDVVAPDTAKCNG